MRGYGGIRSRVGIPDSESHTTRDLSSQPYRTPPALASDGHSAGLASSGKVMCGPSQRETSGWCATRYLVRYLGIY